MNGIKKIEITKVIDMAAIDAYTFLGYQAGEITFEEFVEHTMFNNETHPYFIAEYLHDWLMDQKECKLANISSGSTFTALTCFDNIITTHYEEDEEAMEFGEQQWYEKIYPIILEGRKQG